MTPRGEFKGTLTPTKMSVLSLGSTCALSNTNKKALFDSTVLGLAELAPADGTMPGPVLGDWLGSALLKSRDLLNKIPEAKEAGYLQTFNLDGGPDSEENLDLELFLLEYLPEQSKEEE